MVIGGGGCPIVTQTHSSSTFPIPNCSQTKTVIPSPTPSSNNSFYSVNASNNKDINSRGNNNNNGGGGGNTNGRNEKENTPVYYILSHNVTTNDNATKNTPTNKSNKSSHTHTHTNINTHINTHNNTANNNEQLNTCIKSSTTFKVPLSSPTHPTKPGSPFISTHLDIPLKQQQQQKQQPHEAGNSNITNTGNGRWMCIMTVYYYDVRKQIVETYYVYPTLNELSLDEQSLSTTTTTTTTEIKGTNTNNPSTDTDTDTDTNTKNITTNNSSSPNLNINNATTTTTSTSTRTTITKKKIIQTEITTTTLAEVHLNIVPQNQTFGPSPSHQSTHVSRIPLSKRVDSWIKEEEEAIEVLPKEKYHDDDEEEEKEEEETNEGSATITFKNESKDTTNDTHVPCLQYPVEYTWSDVSPQIIFSENATHLACLLPQPIPTNTTTTSTTTTTSAMTTPTTPTKSNNTNDNGITKSISNGISTTIIFTLKPTRVKGGASNSTIVSHGVHSTTLPLPSYILADENVDTIRNDNDRDYGGSGSGGSGGGGGRENGGGGGVEDLILPPTPTHPLIVSSGLSTLSSLSSSSTTTNNSTTTSSSAKLSTDCPSITTQITSLCNISLPSPSSSSSSLAAKSQTQNLFLVGCTDGSIHMVEYSNAKIIESIVMESSPTSTIASKMMDHHHHSHHSSGIVQMVYESLPNSTNKEVEYEDDEEDEEDKDENTANDSIGNLKPTVSNTKLGGRLLTIQRNGKVALYSVFVPKDGTMRSPTDNIYSTFISRRRRSRSSASSSSSSMMMNGNAATVIRGSGESKGIVVDPRKRDEEPKINGVADSSSNGYGHENGMSNGYHENGYHENGTSNKHPLHLDTTKTAATTTTSATTTPSSTSKLTRMVLRPYGRQQTSGCTYIPTKNNTPLSYVRAIFLDFWTISLLVNPLQIVQHANNEQSNNTVAQVWYFRDGGDVSSFENNDNDDDDSMLEEGEEDDTPILLAELNLTEDKLSELQHAQFQPTLIGKKNSGNTSTGYTCSTTSASFVSIHQSLETNCLAISSAIVIPSKSLSLSSDDVEGIIRPFVTIWDWRKLVCSFTINSKVDLEIVPSREDSGILSSPPTSLVSTSPSGMLRSSIFSHAYFCQNHNDGFMIGHVYRKHGRIQKDLYHMGILSPTSEICDKRQNGRCHQVLEPNPLLVQHDFISYPTLVPTIKREFHLQWNESRIPSSYTVANGSARITAMGMNYGRSIAIAASRGLCILDLSTTNCGTNFHHGATTTMASTPDDQESSSQQYESVIPTICSKSYRCDINEDFPAGLKSIHSKWRRFNEMEERSFTVQAMAWWERDGYYDESEDLLFAIIQYVSSKQKGIDEFYLVCWSRRRLGLNKYQLLSNKRVNNSGKVGIKIPKNFRPSSISIHTDPSNESLNDRDPRAIVLLSSEECGIVSYRAYQLQISGQNHLSTNNSNILSQPCWNGTITEPSLHTSSMSTVFLAGTSFDYDLTGDKVKPTASNEPYNVATLGLICDMGQSLFAFTIHKNGSISSKRIFVSVTSSTSNDDDQIERIDTFWKADSIVYAGEEGDESFQQKYRVVWNFTLTNGDDLCWSVPFSYQEQKHESDTVVDEIDCMGTLCRHNLRGTSLDDNVVLLGPLPSSHWKCIVYTRQNARSLNNGSNLQLYGLDDCVVGPPIFTPSLLTDLLQGDGETVAQSDVTSFSHSSSIINDHQCFASASLALRSVLLHIIEHYFSSKQITSEAEKLRYEKDHQYGENMMRNFTMLSRNLLNTIQFVSLVINTGRSLELHQLNHLFPLTVLAESISVEDLFSIAVNAGSLFIAASALPLLDKQYTHRLCVFLIHHCISILFDFCDEKDIRNLSNIREECLLFHQLYDYGQKLEASKLFKSRLESIPTSESMSDDDANISYDEEDTIEDDLSESETGSAYPGYDSEYEQLDTLPIQLHTPGRISMITNFFRRMMYLSFMQEQNNEIAISKAASSFILTNYDDVVNQAAEKPFMNQEVEINGTSFIDSDHISSLLSETIDDLITKAIISSFTSTSSVESDINLSAFKKILALSLLIEKSSYLTKDEFSTKLKDIKTIIPGFTIIQITKVLGVICCGSMDVSSSKDESNEVVMQNFSRIIHEVKRYCDDQEVTTETAFRLIVSLLKRSIKTKAEQISPTLAVLSLIFGHCCDQSHHLFDVSNETCPLQELYNSYY